MSALNFASYFHELHGVPAFPWQERLAEHLVRHHTWPDLLDLPTASGKTACIDIALFHLAWCAEQGEPWRAARRIIFAVDRRIIVDAAADRAKLIATALEQSESQAVRAVADSLRRLGGDVPLLCHKLRGGMPRERGFALNPTQPMVISSTVDQVGSRLLFRGYGVSPFTWPLHAGLLAFDTLILLDEAHLSAPFAGTIAAVRREQFRAERPMKTIQPVRVVPLSATAHAFANRFQLDARDAENSLLAERKTTPKITRLVEATSRSTERLKALLRETLAAYAEIGKLQSPVVAVIANRVKTARAVFEQLRKESSKRDFSVELLIGRSRPLDRDAVTSRVIQRSGAARKNDPTDRGLIIVATQTIEVGADLDFQALVTECSALDALRQRFGRLDRLGRFRQSYGVIIGGGDADDDPVYGAALNKTWQWLKSVATVRDDEQFCDLSIDEMDRRLKGADVQAMATPPRATIQLTPLHAELLSQTSPSPVYDPDVGALLHGLGTAMPDVQVVWREHLPLARDDRGTVLDARDLETARELLGLNPPSSLEALSLPVSAIRGWLDNYKDKSSLTDVEGVLIEEVDRDRDRLGRNRQVLRRRSGRWDAVFAGDVRPGEIIVVPTAYGGCDEYGFAPDSDVPVRDLSASARVELNRSPLLFITAQPMTPAQVVDVEAAKEMWRRTQEAYRTPQFDAAQHMSLILDLLTDQFRTALSWAPKLGSVDVVLNRDGDLYALVATSAIAKEGDISDEDLSSSQTVPVALDTHNVGVGRRARALASALGLEQDSVETLGRSGDFHDTGKADPRFQQMLRCGDGATLAGQLLAKGSHRAKGAFFQLGERHEAYSVAFLKTNPELLSSAPDPELALYLVGSHHGRGRPLMPDRPDEGARFALDIRGRPHSFDGIPRLGALGSGWASLFGKLNRRYGPWGLAYLETVLRLADWLQSAEELKMGGRE